MKRIRKEIIEKMNNFQLMVYATEEFMQLVYFLEQERDFKDIVLKIGEFEYDDWKGTIYCKYDKYGIRFYHTRDIDDFSWTKKTLLEMYGFAWGFEETEFKFRFEIINDFYDLLNEDDKEIYDILYDEVHSNLW